MTNHLDELYFIWLYEQVGNGGSDRRHTHWELLRQLHSKEFVWFIPNDDNRLEDGRELRHEFLEVHELTDVDSAWMGEGCSMLEMLIALSRRLSFEADGPARDWFWHLLENLRLSKCVDSHVSHRQTEWIEETLNQVIYRTYEPNGEGGLFPLEHAERDQTQVEIWYQLSAYLLERF